MDETSETSETSGENVVEARRLQTTLSVAALDDAAWTRARPVHLTRYWSGATAPPARRAEARLLWDEHALYARFTGAQQEPLIASAQPRIDEKTLGLWDRDVCELFIAPDASEPERYYEFEAAPTGEWLDLAIRKTARGRETEWDYQSGMTTTARISANRITVALCVPWEAFGEVARPQVGKRWRVNLFRCVGAGATRGYVVWQPTHTPEPNFHAPEKFGWLRFIE